MDMMEFLRSRRTYRRFAQRAVAPEILTEAVDAARIASCGANRQTVRYCMRKVIFISYVLVVAYCSAQK